MDCSNALGLSSSAQLALAYGSCSSDKVCLRIPNPGIQEYCCLRLSRPHCGISVPRPIYSSAYQAYLTMAVFPVEGPPCTSTAFGGGPGGRRSCTRAVICLSLPGHLSHSRLQTLSSMAPVRLWSISMQENSYEVRAKISSSNQSFPPKL